MGYDKSRVLVLGRGFLGSRFERDGFRVVGREVFNINNILAGGFACFDYHRLCDSFDVIVNCVGISDTRFCEKPENWEEVIKANGLFPSVLSRLCRNHGKRLVHISTGCLYEGTQGRKRETDPIETHCRYTVSKAVGEFGCDPKFDLIIRPRLLFDDVESPKNLLSKFKNFSRFLDEFNTVTSNRTIVEAVEALLKVEAVGEFNVGNLGTYTIEQLANALGYSGGRLRQVELIDSQGLYLVNNVMDMSKLTRTSGYVPRDAIDEVVEMDNGLLH